LNGAYDGHPGTTTTPEEIPEMFALRASMLLAVLGLFASSEDASARKAPAKEHTFHGHITHVHHVKDGKHHGKIIVKHHHKGTTVIKTFHIHANTNILTGGSSSGSAILHKGLRVAVRHHGGHADEIHIHHKK
jgi:hypothetical protein